MLRALVAPCALALLVTLGGTLRADTAPGDDAGLPVTPGADGLDAGSPAAAARDEAAAAGREPPPAVPIRPGFDGPLPERIALSLADAIRLGLERNLDVEIARHAPLIALEDHSVAWGPFDPTFRSELFYDSQENPVASALQASALLVERRIEGTASVGGLIPLWGAEYQIGYTGSSLETTSSIASLSPEYRTILFATFRAPVLRNFLWSEPWTQVRATRIQHRQSLDRFRRDLMNAVQAIEDAYWELATSREDLGVAEKSLEAAQGLFDQVDAQYEVGVVSRVEVVESEAGVAEREFNRIQAEAALDRAQDRLVDLVFGTALAPETDVAVVTTDSPEDYTVVEVDRGEAVQKALRRRPELALAREQIELRKVLHKFARNQRLPQLDIEVSYGFQGLSGKTNPEEPIFGGVTRQVPVTEPAQINGVPAALTTTQEVPVLDAQGERIREPLNVGRRFSAADDDFFSADGAHQFRAMGVFSIPLFNVAARHRVTREELELRRARTELRRQEQGIVFEIRDAVRVLEAALKGIAAAERRQEAAEEQFRAEGIRLEQGESTPFDVLQRERDLVDAESQRIQALQVYHNALTALARAQGTILESRNLVVDDWSSLR